MVPKNILVKGNPKMYKTIRNLFKGKRKIKDKSAEERPQDPEELRFNQLLGGLIDYLRRNENVTVDVNDYYIGNEVRKFQDSARNVADFLDHNFIHGTSHYYHIGRWQVYASQDEEQHYFEAVKWHCKSGFFYMFERVPDTKFRDVTLEFRVLKESK